MMISTFRRRGGVASRGGGQFDEPMAEDWRGDLGPLANSVTNLFTRTWTHKIAIGESGLINSWTS
jgi:hypothetical protein